MSRTVAATIDKTGTVKLLEPVNLLTTHRAFLTILDSPPDEDELAPACTQAEMAAAHYARAAKLGPGEDGYVNADLPFVDDGADW